MVGRNDFLGRVYPEHSDEQLRKEMIVSQALWCDAKQHPFSSKDPERRHYQQETVRQSDERGYEQGRIVMEEFDICGPCANQTAVFQKPANYKALEARQKGYDPDYVKWLEEQAAKPVEDV